MKVAPTLISDVTLPYLNAAAAESVEQSRRLPERRRALQVLGAECDSWVRLGAGLLTWLVGVGGTGGLTLAAWHGAPVALRVLGLMVCLVLLGLAARQGRRIWRAGRQVVDAFCWWTLLPERLPGGGEGVPDWGASPMADRLHAQVFIYQGWRPLRILVAVLAFLHPLALLSTATTASPRFDAFWPAGQGGALAVAVLLLIAIGWTGGVVIMGGQWRANLASSRRDPMQRGILSVLHRRRRTDRQPD